MTKAVARVEKLRSKALDMSVSIMFDYHALNRLQDDTLKVDTQQQMLKLVETCALVLEQTVDDAEDVKLLGACLEIIRQLK